MSWNFGYGRPIGAIVTLSLNYSITHHYFLRWICLVALCGQIGACCGRRRERARSWWFEAGGATVTSAHHITTPPAFPPPARPPRSATQQLRLATTPACDTFSEADLSSHITCQRRGECEFAAGYNSVLMSLYWYRDLLALFLEVWALVTIAYLSAALGLFHTTRSHGHASHGGSRRDIERGERGGHMRGASSLKKELPRLAPGGAYPGGGGRRRDRDA